MVSITRVYLPPECWIAEQAQLISLIVEEINLTVSGRYFMETTVQAPKLLVLHLQNLTS